MELVDQARPKRLSGKVGPPDGDRQAWQTVWTHEHRVNGNRVLVKQHITARGAGNGIELDLDNWAVWTLDEDGLATRVESFRIHEESEALEAAGLPA